jgi:hypothetical protein
LSNIAGFEIALSVIYAFVTFCIAQKVTKKSRALESSLEKLRNSFQHERLMFAHGGWLK